MLLMCHWTVIEPFCENDILVEDVGLIYKYWKLKIYTAYVDKLEGTIKERGAVSKFDDNNVFDFSSLLADISPRPQTPLGKGVRFVLRYWRLYECKVDLYLHVMSKLNPWEVSRSKIWINFACSQLHPDSNPILMLVFIFDSFSFSFSFSFFFSLFSSNSKRLPLFDPICAPTSQGRYENKWK